MKRSSQQKNYHYEHQALIFKALSNPTRLHLVDLLCKKQRWASELQEGLGISKANLSQHLSVLKAAGLVSTERDGKQLFCGIAMPAVKIATASLRNGGKAMSRARR
jgi:DNA-binding transcriptional ArsR family regulator